ncbi:MAG TPA: NAD-dependent epimerase/dehydratase family protein, partial [Chloroflexia bacterium]|nr:NAD-dependent epimerase/dehydratase family protein [Chloroflexia bacterium]
IAIDNFNDYYAPARKHANLAAAQTHPRFLLAEIDLRDEGAVEAVFAGFARQDPITRIIHLAAMAGPRFSVHRPELYLDVNEKGTLYLLQAAVRHHVEVVALASSSSVYGKDATVPFQEGARTDRPASPYAATKKAMEVMAYTFHHLYGLNVNVLRFFTVYGARGRPDMAVYLFTDAIAHGRPLTLFGDGSEGRDYTYIDDNVSGVVAAAYRPLGYQLINLGNSHPETNRHLIAVIEATLGQAATIVAQPYPASDPKLTCADITVARQLLDYDPQTRLEEGIPRFVDWYRRTILASEPASAQASIQARDKENSD